MGILKQANKLKGKEREQFLKEYYEAKERLKAVQDPSKKKRKNKKCQD